MEKWLINCVYVYSFWFYFLFVYFTLLQKQQLEKSEDSSKGKYELLSERQSVLRIFIEEMLMAFLLSVLLPYILLAVSVLWID